MRRSRPCSTGCQLSLLLYGFHTLLPSRSYSTIQGRWLWSLQPAGKLPQSWYCFKKRRTACLGWEGTPASHRTLDVALGGPSTAPRLGHWCLQSHGPDSRTARLLHGGRAVCGDTTPAGVLF